LFAFFGMAHDGAEVLDSVVGTTSDRQAGQ
jgi:hypothetical protein